MLLYICTASTCVCARTCARVPPLTPLTFPVCLLGFFFFFPLPVRLLSAAPGDSPAALTWPRLTLAFLNESCSCGRRLRLKCGSLAGVITPLARQKLGYERCLSFPHWTWHRFGILEYLAGTSEPEAGYAATSKTGSIWTEQKDDDKSRLSKKSYSRHEYGGKITNHSNMEMILIRWKELMKYNDCFNEIVFHYWNREKHG